MIKIKKKSTFTLGKYHAGILTNNEDMELACVKAGQNCGDLVHPVPYSPELHFPEFNSAVADMKNSVAVSGLYIYFEII
jgi:probable aminopeptidase NPEPL1